VVANISFGEARSAAINAVNFEPGGNGLTTPQAKTILDELGVPCRQYAQVDDWSELPDLAVIGITVQDGVSAGMAHSVVFARTDNGEFIFDNLNDGPVSRDGYVLRPFDDYLEIL